MHDPKQLSQFFGNIEGIVTAHGTGNKKVFRFNHEMPHAMTQIAHGTFKPGEICEEHEHPTMYEYFYFLSGEGTYIVGENEYELKAGVFLEIPAGVKHRLEAKGSSDLTFVYWGIATD
jgi:quercetin dioxygenase-like cupin family protein